MDPAHRTLAFQDNKLLKIGHDRRYRGGFPVIFTMPHSPPSPLLDLLLYL